MAIFEPPQGFFLNSENMLFIIIW